MSDISLKNLSDRQLMIIRTLCEAHAEGREGLGFNELYRLLKGYMAKNTLANELVKLMNMKLVEEAVEWRRGKKKLFRLSNTIKKILLGPLKPEFERLKACLETLDEFRKVIVKRLSLEERALELAFKLSLPTIVTTIMLGHIISKATLMACEIFKEDETDPLAVYNGLIALYTPLVDKVLELFTTSLYELIVYAKEQPDYVERIIHDVELRKKVMNAIAELLSEKIKEKGEVIKHA